MLVYGILGLIFSSIGAVISTYVPCGDETIPKLSKTVCDYKENNQTYYFDNYNIFFLNLYHKQFGIKLFLLIIKCSLNFFSVYYMFAIFKILNPIYYMFAYRFNSLILTILGFINFLINEDYQLIYLHKYILDILLLIFYIFGSIIYLEFIELNCYNLNFYTNRNIIKRARSDIKLTTGDTSISSELSDFETT